MTEHLCPLDHGSDDEGNALAGVLVTAPCGARVYAPGEDYFTCELPTAAHDWHQEAFVMRSPDDPISVNGPGILYEVVIRWRRR